jgi:cell division protease FtsH
MAVGYYIYTETKKNPVTEVDYKTFITQVDEGGVKSVEIQDNQIKFIVANKDGTESTYITGIMDDPDLTNRLLQANVQFTKDIPAQTSPIIGFLLTWILPIVLLLALWRFLFGRMGGGAGRIDNAMTFGKSSAKIYAESETGKSFADVAGQDEAKEALQEIIDFLHNPQKYKEIGAKIPKGILLVGPPGTGKTLLAKAVAGESKVPFFSISGSEFIEMFVGVGAARVRDLFEQAQAKAPCIVFIDEIDTIGKSRNLSGITGNDEREQTLHQLLNEMDGFSTEKGVVILAATNRPEDLDKALLRPGRFDRRIPVELPDVAGREAVLMVHARNVKMDNDVNLKEIAKATSGASGADLANIVNEAALHAVREGRRTVKQSDLEYSIEIVVAGYQRKNAVISKEDRLAVAYHEIGHAIVAARQTHCAPVHKISIIPRTSGTLGYTMQVEEKDQYLMSKEKALEKITTYMGGRSAEELILQTITSGAANDIEFATKIARSMVTRFGMSEEFDMMALETVNNPYLGTDTTLLVSNETSAKIDDEVLRIIKSCHEKAKEILKANEPKLHELAKYLVEKETISGQEFMEILLRQE